MNLPTHLQPGHERQVLSAALGQFAADLAHKLNNPVGGLMGLAQLLLEGKKLGPQERQDVETILAQGQRCRAILQDILLFRPQPHAVMEKMDFSVLAHGTLEGLRLDFLKFELTVVDQCPPSLPWVLGDASQLQQVFLHLLLAARHAMAGQNKKTLTLQGEENAGRVRIAVQHTGPALSEDFQQTDLAWQICRDILEKHAGTVSSGRHAKTGAYMTMELPVYA
jgi:two-component system NtrC family sensor kinase